MTAARTVEYTAVACILVGMAAGSTTLEGAILFIVGGVCAALTTWATGLRGLTALNCATVLVALINIARLYA
jgi:hypothetical protein